MVTTAAGMAVASRGQPDPARLAWTLLGAVLLGTALVSLTGFWLVRRGLRPLKALAERTAAMAPDRPNEPIDALAFAEELHHRKEHSVELAVVWLHYARQGRPLPLVPILCGSFHPYTEGEAEAAAEPRFARLIETLTRCLAGRRAVVVAAADLAHVGPAFGDPHPLTLAERRALRQADMALLGAIGAGDPEAFLGMIRAGRDRYRICGLPPIYLALRLLAGRARGLVTGYAHCPADAQNGSVVSIAGVLLVA